MCIRKLLTSFLFILFADALYASPMLFDLDSCRALAIANNKELSMADIKSKMAYYQRKSAFTAYLPKISASGLYMRTGDEFSLLSDEQKASLPHLGDAMAIPALNSVGQTLVDALHTDTRNITGAAVMLTQPLYMGGKIRAYNNITRFAETIALMNRDLKYQELLVEVDETYWKIVELAARKKLAEGYKNLVTTLNDDIEQMIEVGVATKADGLSVKVKVNEADVAIIQVDNGIQIMKMKMCQLCGLPLDSQLVLTDEDSSTRHDIDCSGTDNSEAWMRRPELSMLAQSSRIFDEKVRIARAEFLPKIALTGGYFANYPSVFNSFEKKFKGTWNVGVALTVPIVTWGDRTYKVKAAKAEATMQRLNLEETREKIELQVSQCRQKVDEAQQRYEASVSSMAEADENLRYATLGLKEGVVPVSNVIEAQTAWLAANANLITADIDIRLAYVYLRKSLGTVK